MVSSLRSCAVRPPVIWPPHMPSHSLLPCALPICLQKRLFKGPSRAGSSICLGVFSGFVSGGGGFAVWRRAGLLEGAIRFGFRFFLAGSRRLRSLNVVNGFHVARSGALC